MKKKTPQELADFFECYVAMDKDEMWYGYPVMPKISERIRRWEAPYYVYLYSPTCGLNYVETPPNHDWHTLYRPNQEPIIVKGE